MKKLILFVVVGLICGGIAIVTNNLLWTISIIALSGGGLYLLLEEKSNSEKIMDFMALLIMVFSWMAIAILTSNSFYAFIGIVVLISLYLLWKHFFYNSKREIEST